MEPTQQKERSRLAFDRQAWSYDTASYGAHARALYPVLLAQLEQIPHQSVLDVGCGTGALLQAVRAKFPGTECTGLDLSENMLSAAKAKLGSAAALYQGDAAQLPFDGGRFDAVLCCDSFHHYPEPECALSEMARVLRPGGVLLLADCTAPDGVRPLVNLLLPLSSEGDVRLYGTGELSALLGRYFTGADCRRIGAGSLLAWGVRKPSQPAADRP